MRAIRGSAALMVVVVGLLGYGALLPIAYEYAYAADEEQVIITGFIPSPRGLFTEVQSNIFKDYENGGLANPMDRGNLVHGTGFRRPADWWLDPDGDTHLNRLWLREIDLDDLWFARAWDKQASHPGAAGVTGDGNNRNHPHPQLDPSGHSYFEFMNAARLIIGNPDVHGTDTHRGSYRLTLPPGFDPERERYVPELSFVNLGRTYLHEPIESLVMSRPVAVADDLYVRNSSNGEGNLIMSGQWWCPDRGRSFCGGVIMADTTPEDRYYDNHDYPVRIHDKDGLFFGIPLNRAEQGRSTNSDGVTLSLRHTGASFTVADPIPGRVANPYRFMFGYNPMYGNINTTHPIIVSVDELQVRHPATPDPNQGGISLGGERRTTWPKTQTRMVRAPFVQRNPAWWNCTATCPAGYVATGGGWGGGDPQMPFHFTENKPTDDGLGWYVSTWSSVPNTGPVSQQCYAMCAQGAFTP